MKNLKAFLSIILSLFNGMYKIMKDVVVPAISFIQFIKSLIDDKNFKTAKNAKKDEDFNFIEWLIEKLGWTETMVKKFVDAFMVSIKILLPDIVTADTFFEALREFIGYLRTLGDAQKAFLFFKLASIMVIHLVPEKKLKDTEADFMVQLAYTKLKLTDKI